jgi:hypothetical protein
MTASFIVGVSGLMLFFTAVTVGVLYLNNHQDKNRPKKLIELK